MKITHMCLFSVAVAGILLCLMNVFFGWLLQTIEQYKMTQMLTIKRDSFSFPFWEKPPVPVYFELYMFHISNYAEVLQGSTPLLVERGPYTYRVSLEKSNVTFNDNNTVTYKQVQTFVFDRDLSVGEENDTFTTINAPLFTVGTLLQFEASWLQTAVNALLEELGEVPLVTVSVYDIFWGYEDRFLQLVKKVLDKFQIKSRIITGKFGYYMDKNNTDDGQYTVNTGADDLSKFLIINSWNGKRCLDYWSTKWANMINGTDGSLFPPFVTKDRILRMYDSNLYRSLSMVYSHASSVQAIRTMKFVVEEKEFANASANPDNAGFCTPFDNCIPSGVLNCSAMGNGAPIYLSLPHFLGADPYYFAKVHGLQPNKPRHQPYFHLHQLTGVCLAAARRYQLNIQVKEFSFLSKTHGIRFAYVPVLWINGVAEIDRNIADMFKSEIETPLAAAMAFHYALFAMSPPIIFCSLLVVYQLKQKGKKKVLV